MKSFIGIILTSLFFISCKEKPDVKVLPKESSIEKVVPKEINEIIEKISKDSNNSNNQFQLVNTLDSLGYQKQSLQQLDKLITKDSLNNDYWLKRGQLCKVLEDTASAIKAFHYAARIYPSPIALMELANLYAETKKANTISVCNQLMKMNPDGSFDAQANFFIGVYYSKIKDENMALSYFNKAIQKDFHFDDAYIEKGYLLYNNKKFVEALKTFKQLTTVNQTSVDGYYWLGKCYEALNNKSDAIKNYQSALLLNTDLNEATEAIERLQNRKLN